MINKYLCQYLSIIKKINNSIFYEPKIKISLKPVMRCILLFEKKFKIMARVVSENTCDKDFHFHIYQVSVSSQLTGSKIYW